MVTSPCSPNEKKWLIYWTDQYQAVPWPFRQNWEEFVENPEPLVGTVDHFGRVSPSDGFGEMGSVPRNLPRELPHGQYGAALYHDREWLYVFLGAEYPDAIEDLKPFDSFRMNLGIMSKDTTCYHQLTSIRPDRTKRAAS